MRRAIPLLLLSAVVSITSFKSDNVEQLRNANTTRGLKILVISDLNAAYGSTSYSPDVVNTIQDIPAIKPDLILCGGDMVAGQKSTLSTQDIEAMWMGFKSTVLGPIAQLKIAFGFTLGNHDASPNFAKDRACAEKFWKDEVKSIGLTFVDSTHYPFYFSYVKNNVFMISWDATAAKIKPEVMDWMKQQLKQKIAKKAGFRIVLGHLPLYAIVESKNKPGEVNADPEYALDLFKENNVDLYISGHQHAYFPAHKEGVKLLNLGCIGDGPRRILGSANAAIKSYTVIDIPVKEPKKFVYKTVVPTTNVEIDIKSLPDSVKGFNGTTKRQDVAYP